MDPKRLRDPYAGPEPGPESPFPIKLYGPVIKGFGRGSKEVSHYQCGWLEARRGLDWIGMSLLGRRRLVSLSKATGHDLVRSHAPTRQGSSFCCPCINPQAFQTGITNRCHVQLGIPTANIPPEGLAAYPSLDSGVYYGFVGLALSPSPDTPSRNTAVYPAVLSIGFNPFYKNTVRSVEIHLLHDFAHDFYGAALNLLMLGFIRPEYDYVSLEALVDDIKTDCDVARRSLQRPAYDEFQQDGWLKDFEWMKAVDTAQVERKVLNKD